VSWRPIVEDEAERARMLAVAGEIAEAMAALPALGNTDDLADHAILRAYLGCDDDGEEDLGGEALASAIRMLGASTSIGPGLHGGAAKVGWAVAHLAAGDDADAVTASVERSILALLQREEVKDYDLVSGLVGIGVFALERGEAGRALAVRVLDHLERSARPHRGGTAWLTVPEILPAWQRELAPHGYWNLGLAHGSAGAIALLARYVAAGIETARARRLLDGAVAHLLSCALPGDGGRFPGWITEGADARDATTRRVAWCYGDLGISVALLAAADATGDAGWRAEALATAHASARCPEDASGIADGGLCHGTAGAAHLFNRLYQASGEPALGEAARLWLARTLRIRNAQPIAGYPAARFDDGVQSWLPEANALVGAPGVALVLHAACNELEPAWDRLLLC
jgi:hypothetical protein